MFICMCMYVYMCIWEDSRWIGWVGQHRVGGKAGVMMDVLETNWVLEGSGRLRREGGGWEWRRRGRRMEIVRGAAFGALTGSRLATMVAAAMEQGWMGIRVRRSYSIVS